MGVKKILFERRRVVNLWTALNGSLRDQAGAMQALGRALMKVASRKIIWTKLSSDEFTYAKVVPRYRLTIRQFSGG